MKRLSLLAIAGAVALIVCYFVMIRMPGASHRGALPALTELQGSLSDELRQDVYTLADTIGPRCAWMPVALERSAVFFEQELSAAGLTPVRQCFDVGGVSCCNVEAEVSGRSDEIIVIGAHYDTAVHDPRCPGANDNASGCAATLALARRFAGGPKPARTLRFVLFVNEEAPHFQTEDMGSVRYARRCRERGEQIFVMISLETIGCYSDQPKTQDYPPPLSLLYPSTGNFIAVVGNVPSRARVRDFIERFRRLAAFPSEGAAVPGALPGVGWSDHWAFWKAGYDAIMLTDTALYRDRNYHEHSDTAEKLDYDRMARVVEGTEAVLREWCMVTRIQPADFD